MVRFWAPTDTAKPRNTSDTQSDLRYMGISRELESG
jgi:hypothetical protein